MISIRHFFLAGVASVAVAAPASAVTFTKVADTGVAVPGSGTGNFTFFERSAVIRNGNVAFRGEDANFDQGIYFWDGSTITEIVHASDSVPGVPGETFEDGFDSELSLEGNTIGFEGFTSAPNFNEAVITATTGGTLTNVADPVNTINPVTGNPFTGINEPSISGGFVAFQGEDVNIGQEGIYTNATGSLTTVITSGGALPGIAGYTTTGFDSELSFSGNNIAIQANINDGTNFEQAILLATITGAITVIADTVNTISPTSGALFDDLDEFSIDGANIAFGGGSGASEGIYTNIGGPLTIVADTNTAAPGQGGELFTFFNEDEVSIGGDQIVFDADTINGGGIFYWKNGLLGSIITDGQILDGKTVTDVDVLTDSAIDGNQAVFTAFFDDGSSGIFVANDVMSTVVPLPAGIALMGAAIGGFGVLRLFRRTG